MADLKTESYIWQEIQRKMLPYFQDLYWDMGANRVTSADWYPDSPGHRAPTERLDWDPHKSMAWSLNPRPGGDKDNRRHNMISFGAPGRYGPDSRYWWGKTVITSDQDEKIEGLSNVFDNTLSDEDKEFEISHKETMTSGASTTFATETHFDVTSTTEVKGNMGGVEASQALEVAFGTKIGTEEKKFEETSYEDSVEEELIVPARTKCQVTYEKCRVITETPFRVSGVVDWSIWMYFDWWAGQHSQMHSSYCLARYKDGNHKILEFAGFNELKQFLHGYDTRYPFMKGFAEHCWDRTKRAMKYIFDPENRKVDVEGVLRRTADNNLTWTAVDMKSGEELGGERMVE